MKLPRIYLRTGLVLAGLLWLLPGAVAQEGQSGEQRSGATHQEAGTEIFVRRDPKTAPNIARGNPVLQEALVDRFSKVKGVKRVAYGLVDVVMIFGLAISDPIILEGLPADSPYCEDLRIQAGGQKLADDDRQKIMIGRDLAKKLDKTVGDEMELYGSEKFQIVGVFFSHAPFENTTAIVPLKELQRLMNRPGEINGVTITTEQPLDEAGIDDMCKRLEAVAPGLLATKVIRPGTEGKAAK